MPLPRDKLFSSDLYYDDKKIKKNYILKGDYKSLFYLSECMNVKKY